MTLETLLKTKGFSKADLSHISGIPNTTILDICAGRSLIKNCKADTVIKLALALGCSMENIMLLVNNQEYDTQNGKPTDAAYLEQDLPQYLQSSIQAIKKSWEKEARGEKDLNWDVAWCDLNADINYAETEQVISSEQAWYLREKYLGMERV